MFGTAISPASAPTRELLHAAQPAGSPGGFTANNVSTALSNGSTLVAATYRTRHVAPRWAVSGLRAAYSNFRLTTAGEVDGTNDVTVGVNLAAAADTFSSASPALRPEAALPTATTAAGAYDWNAVFGEKWRGDGPGWAPAGAVAYTPALMKRLTAVARDNNARIVPASDEDAFGAADVWALPLSEGLGPRGNCKHYVLEKRRALIGEGVPAAALSIAVVRTPQGVVHAALLVSTDHGEYVLDNLSPWVVPWTQAG